METSVVGHVEISANNFVQLIMQQQCVDPGVSIVPHHPFSLVRSRDRD
jgi:hypothetical protein